MFLCFSGWFRFLASPFFISLKKKANLKCPPQSANIRLLQLQHYTCGSYLRGVPTAKNIWTWWHAAKVDTASFNMVIFYPQLRPGLPTVIGGRVEEQDRCLWKLWKHLNYISVNLWTCHIWSIIIILMAWRNMMKYHWNKHDGTISSEHKKTIRKPIEKVT